MSQSLDTDWQRDCHKSNFATMIVSYPYRENTKATDIGVAIDINWLYVACGAIACS